MTSERELIERGIAAWNEGGVEAFAEFLAPDVVWHAPPGFPTGEVWYDRESLLPEIRDQFGQGGVFSSASIKLVGMLEAPNGWFVETRQDAIHTSGTKIDWVAFFVVQFQDEQVKEIWTFMDREPALRQAGLGDEEAAVQRALSAWNEGIDAFIEVLAPDVEWHAPPGFPEGDVWYGHDAVAGVLREVWTSVFRGQGVQPDQIARGREAWMLGGRQKVVHESGMTLEWEEFVVLQLEQGLVRRAWIFRDRESAARQAGLAD